MRKKPKNASCYNEMQRKGKRGQTQVWRAWVEKQEVITQWGILDGKMQETVDIPGPKGKPGTKGFITPEQSARNEIIRGISKKARAGYEVVSCQNATVELQEELDKIETGGEIDFEGPLPDNVAFSKPVNSFPIERVKKLAESEAKPLMGGPKLVWTIKMNGMCYIVSSDLDGDIWIQSRGKLHVENDKFPHLVEEFQALLPPKSILLCEFYVREGKTRKDFLDMQSITNSLPDRALQMQKKLGLVHAYVFRAPYWKGAKMEETTLNALWLDFVQALDEGWDDEARPFGQQVGLSDSDFLHPPLVFEGSYDQALDLCRDEGYEGWVVYMRDLPLGPEFLNFRGQPDRPRSCFKVKAEFEDDFVGIWDPDGTPQHCGSECHIPDKAAAAKQSQSGKCCVCGKRLKPSGSYGSGKNRERVGAISLYQFDPHGVRQYICEVSSGLSDKKKSAIAKEGLLVDVINVGYQDRQYVRAGGTSNALYIPRVIGFRKDKELNECVNPDL